MPAGSAPTQRYTGTASRTMDRPPVYRLGVEACTISGALVLTPQHARYLSIDGGAASRDVTLPEGSDGDLWHVYNRGATDNLVVRDSDGNALKTVTPGKALVVGFEDSTPVVLLFA